MSYKINLILLNKLRNIVKGDISVDDLTCDKFSRDSSLFEVRPNCVISPKDVDDIKTIVRFSVLNKKENPDISITARSAGTDMTGGPLNESIILDFSKYFNKTNSVDDFGLAVVSPGVMYRDFEKIAAEKNYFLPSYPASKNICAIGGMINNNAGGEKTLIYGKTDRYIHELKVVLADGNEHVFKELSRAELDDKMSRGDFEGQLYRSVFKILDDKYDLISQSKPKVSKNSVGYNIWGVWDKELQKFNLTKLFIGSQGTLGITTEATFRLVKTKPDRGMLVIFLKNLNDLAQIINLILPFKPASLESFDDHTLKLSFRFLSGFLKLLGAKNMLSLFSRFIPDLWLILKNGMPKLVILAEFEGVEDELILENIKELKSKLKNFGGINTRIAKSNSDIEKYFAIRRESFNLLRKKVLGKQTAPFIDDIIVEPKFLPQFLPELYKILDKYQLLYTIAGHVGNGNFHIIPLMNLADEFERKKIFGIMREVYALVLRYGGSISAEHGDGMIRGPFIRDMFGDDIFSIFKQIKNIFDPLNIFNPHKKTDANWDYSFEHIKN